MKKINKNICFAALGVALLLPVSCKKVLNKKDTTNVSGDALFHTPQDGISLVNAIYDGFQHNNQSFVLKSLWYNANYTTQDYFNWGADVSYNNYQFTSTFGSLNDFWNLSYQGIARANAAIPIIAQMKTNGVLTDALANRLTGECYFLRGVYYYYLACTFGGVPLELKTVTDNGLHPRNSESDVWTAVAADMTTASGLLPWPEDEATSDIGRATKGAALGYLGAADMWLKKYTDALSAFTQIGPHYQLLPSYMDIQEYDHQNNAESIFELQFDNPTGGKEDWNGGNEVTWMSSFQMPWEITTFGYTYANQKLHDSFETGDLRRAATIIGPDEENTSPGIVKMGGIKSYPHVIQGFNGATAPAIPASHYTGRDGKIINTCGKSNDQWTGDSPGQPRSGYYGMKMWRDPNITGAVNSPVDGIQHIFGDQNVVVLRYGEIVLDMAECYFKNGDLANANAMIMKIRNRAWGGSGAPAPPQSDFMQAMLMEYRHELSGEMSLWYDLRRTGLHIQYIKDNFGITIPAGHDIMPLPQQALDTNPTLKQNPNY